MLAERTEEVAVGDVVTVLADDEATRPDIPAWCHMQSQKHVGEVSSSGAPPTPYAALAA